MEKTNIDTIYSTLQLMNKNSIIEFLIKMETLNLDEFKDKTIILNYIDMINNYIAIVKNMNLENEYLKKLKALRISFIEYLNNRTANEINI